jgi:hypothetical protein
MPESEEPTTTQLANFACVMTYGFIVPSYRDLIEAMFNESPVLREQWVDYHADFQERLKKLAQEDDNV